MDFLKLFQIIASTLAGGTVAVLHSTGADKHKTVAGQVAGVLGIAAQVAQATHDAMLESTATAPAQATAPNASQTP